MNRYRALSEYAEAVYGAGEHELDLSATEEADALSGGHFELVPRTYRQLSNNYSAAEQGETFEAAFLIENEAALIAGGHIERVDDPKPKPRTKRGSNQKEED